MFEMVDAVMDNTTGKPYLPVYPMAPPKKYTDIMVDLETLDTCPSAAILSIGAVAFNIDEPETVKEYLYGVDCTARSFEVAVGLEHQGDSKRGGYDRTISASTFRWWLRQSEDARKKISETNTVALYDSLVYFSEWVRGVHLVEKPRLWGNGAAFDNAILGDAYAKCNIEYPVTYNKNMCYRTMKAMFMPGKVEVPDQQLLTAHNARHDAILQAVILQKIWREWGTKAGVLERLCCE